MCSVDGQWLEGAYHALVAVAGVDHSAAPTPSYSFQLTRTWMLLVPRTSAEAPEGVASNTVGYAGAALRFLSGSYMFFGTRFQSVQGP